MSFYGRGSRWWENLLKGENPALPFRKIRHFLGLIPSDPRCKFCHAPFEGPAKPVLRLVGKRPSRLTPDLCLQCESFARNIPGGAEIELTMLFADVRGSTRLAEEMSPLQYSELVNEFYVSATEILVESHGWVDRLVGDQVIGLYIPGFAGNDHAQLAIRSAVDLLVEMGHSGDEGPRLPIGAGVHTDVAFVGAVGTAEGATDITVLGDAANTSAWLSSVAAAGEVLVSSSAAEAAQLDVNSFEKRELVPKGKSETVEVVVIRASQRDRL